MRPELILAEGVTLLHPVMGSAIVWGPFDFTPRSFIMKKLLALVVISAFLGGCAATGGNGTADVCLFQPSKAAKVSVEFEGEQVGFCCKKCKGKFESMDQAAKKAAIAKSKK